MSFTYSGNPASSSLDESRFLLSDTDSKNPIMQDEEIEYIMSQAGSDRNLRLYLLFTQAATLFARTTKRSLGPQSEDPTARLNYFNQQAIVYKNKCSSQGISIPHYDYPKVFRKGMQNNPPWPVEREGGRYVR